MLFIKKYTIVEVRDTVSDWCEAIVCDKRGDHFDTQFYIRYIGWPKQYNEWVGIDRIAHLGTWLQPRPADVSKWAYVSALHAGAARARVPVADAPITPEMVEAVFESEPRGPASRTVRGPWACPVCTYMNADAAGAVCAMCSTPAPASAFGELAPSTDVVHPCLKEPLPVALMVHLLSQSRRSEAMTRCPICDTTVPQGLMKDHSKTVHSLGLRDAALLPTIPAGSVVSYDRFKGERFVVTFVSPGRGSAASGAMLNILSEDRSSPHRVKALLVTPAQIKVVRLAKPPVYGGSLENGSFTPGDDGNRLAAQSSSLGSDVSLVAANKAAVPVPVPVDNRPDFKVGEIVWSKFRHSSRGKLWYSGVVLPSPSAYLVQFIDNERGVRPKHKLFRRPDSTAPLYTNSRHGNGHTAAGIGLGGVIQRVGYTPRQLEAQQGQAAQASGSSGKPAAATAGLSTVRVARSEDQLVKAQLSARNMPTAYGGARDRMPSSAPMVRMASDDLAAADAQRADQHGAEADVGAIGQAGEKVEEGEGDGDGEGKADGNGNVEGDAAGQPSEYLVRASDVVDDHEDHSFSCNKLQLTMCDTRLPASMSVLEAAVRYGWLDSHARRNRGASAETGGVFVDDHSIMGHSYAVTARPMYAESTEPVVEVGNGDVKPPLVLAPRLDAFDGLAPLPKPTFNVCNDQAAGQGAAASVGAPVAELPLLAEAGVDAAVLQLLHVLREVTAAAVRTSLVLQSDAPKSSDFHSTPLSRKLRHQVRDPLAMASHAAPAWCWDIAHQFPWLVPSSLRTTLFDMTSFGPVKPMKRFLASFNEAVKRRGGTPATLPVEVELKLVVTRSRVLQSAQRLMEKLAREFGPRRRIKSVSEQDAGARNYTVSVGFSGEVGHGVGPTLEFYTLVCDALQDVPYMWRRAARDGDDGAASHDDSGTVSEEEKVTDASRPKSGDAVAGTDAHEAVGSDAAGAAADKEAVKEETVTARGLGALPAGGLFPAMLPPTCSEQTRADIIDLFQFAGRFVAQALQDERPLDLPMSPAFCRVLLQRPVTVAHVRHVDAEFAASLEHLESLAAQTAKLAALPAGSGRDAKLASLREQVDAMYLTFSIANNTPDGEPAIELVPGGCDVDVTVDNVGEFVQRATRALLFDTVQEQVRAFLRGVNDIFPAHYLGAFTPAELAARLGAGDLRVDDPRWEADNILPHLKLSHGYTIGDRQVADFVRLLTNLTIEERRLMIKWLTGSPRLPRSGFRGFSPPLTIVARSNIGDDADDMLPTVSTCMMYLKLPRYSTYEAMRRKFMTAIRDGQHSFDMD